MAWAKDENDNNDDNDDNNNDNNDNEWQNGYNRTKVSGDK